jgi:predicted nucleic acid-binding protein
VYVDTAVLLKLLVRESDSAHYVRLVDGQEVWSSELTFTEVYSALLRKQREGAISAAHRRRAFARVDADVAARRLSLLPVSREVLTTANVILDACSPHVALRSLDALHLASAREIGSWPLCTNDGRMRAAAERLALPLCALPA